VGAAFDYHAGTLSRAPRWMQRRGLEWLHRLRQDPERLWRRYLLLNPAYLSLLALQAASPHRFAPERGTPPDRMLRPS
jgi:N-acetylglucosaminyldiphosphoundecaprenol N-acetyl-beta-D-mannosaminyltransferase